MAQNRGDVVEFRHANVRIVYVALALMSTSPPAKAYGDRRLRKVSLVPREAPIEGPQHEHRTRVAQRAAFLVNHVEV